MKSMNGQFTPFLQSVADDLFEQFGTDLSHVTIIAPNKRANLFFNQYLSRHITDKPIWTPRFITIGEVFDMLCPMKVADPIQLICKLYEAYKTVSKTEETLDKFYSWAELMKNDFEDIDNNLADAKMLFSNIEDLEKMTDFSFLSDTQRNAIYQYFQDFNKGRDSRLKERFLGVWQYMFDTYTEYRRLLKAENICYSGMQKRYVVEGIKNGSINLSEHLNEGVYVVLGFNVLNETEKAIFKSIRQERETLFYWDYDQKYLDSEAGRFVSENLKEFNNRFSNRPEIYQHFGTQNSVKFVKAPTENAQIRYVSKWLDSQVFDHPLQESVIVLCNENVLQPVLHSIPNNSADKTIDLNVTMGYPVKETPIFSFVQSLVDLQLHGNKGNGAWRYGQVAVVLKHPYTRRMVGDAALDVLARLKQKNIMFPNQRDVTCVISKGENDTEEVTSIDFLQSLFRQVNGHIALTEYLMDIVKSVGKSYKDELIKMKENKETNFELQLYVESIFTVHSVLSRFHTLQEREPIFNVNNSTLSRLLMQMLQQKSVPFHGEPAIGLQVMGLLETRNLDFRNVIMLSVNEGQIPKQERMASLIPYALRDAYGMTTIEKQVSLYAFYFYNLLQRAENVTLMYNSSTDGMTTGEMSRFMMQMQVESNIIFGEGKGIDLISLTAPNESHPISEVKIEKTDEVKRKLSEISFISPSSINHYIDCSLLFYFEKIAGFKEDNEVSEGVDNPTFGNIFHRSMEEIYRPLLNRQLFAADLNKMADDKEFINAIVDKAFAIEFFKMPENLPSYHPSYNGEQLLNKYVICDYVKNQLRYDAESCPMTIKGVEEYMSSSIVLNDGKTTINFGGIIDRYEIVHNNYGESILRITDYKTNAKAQKAKTLEEIFDSDTKDRAYNYLQALYYCDVVSRHLNPDIAIMPALMYIKSAVKERDYHLKFGNEPVEDYVKQYQAKYRDLLREKLSELLLSDKPFTQNEHYCETCPFVNYCKV